MCENVFDFNHADSHNTNASKKKCVASSSEKIDVKTPNRSSEHLSPYLVNGEAAASTRITGVLAIVLRAEKTPAKANTPPTTYSEMTPTPSERQSWRPGGNMPLQEKIIIAPHPTRSNGPINSLMIFHAGLRINVLPTQIPFFTGQSSLPTTASEL